MDSVAPGADPRHAAQRSAYLARWAPLVARLLPAGSERLLLVGLGFGEGHNAAARGLEQIVNLLCPHVATRFLDPVADPGMGVWRRRRDAYFRVLRRSPAAYHRAYRLLDHLPWLLHPFLGSLHRWLRRETVRFRPDAIAASHVFCALAAQELRRRGGVATVTGIVTDFLDDAYWHRTRLDHYLVATPELQARLERRAGAPGRVHAPGLPVAPGLFCNLSQVEARRRLDLAPDRPTVLILGGGDGFGAVAAASAAVAGMELSAQVVSAAGRNAALQRHLESLGRRSRTPLRAIGYTTRIGEYLAAADVVVTKPGGMTVAECLAVGLPMILFGAPLPGPESLNRDYLVAKGLATGAADPRALETRLRTVLPQHGGVP